MSKYCIKASFYSKIITHNFSEALKSLLIVMVSSFFISCLEARPERFLDPTDVCILTCDKCYKKQALLNCANNCLDTSGKVSPFWRRQCPYFETNGSSVMQNLIY